MKLKLALLTVLLGTITLALQSIRGPVKADGSKSPTDKNGALSFAIVELFTSEGCASCPPADALLGEIVSKAREENQRVFALAFHVDYWDYIGWKDPFADKAFSERQRRYAQAFRSNRIYTPQMIVNGKSEFVGSNRSQARQELESALSRPAAISLKLTMGETRTSNVVRLTYELSAVPKDAVLQIALVERDIVNEIERGENSGRTLRHENVVRTFKTLTLGEEGRGEVELKVPPEVNLEKSSVIGYVQVRSTMEIPGATELLF